MANSTILYAGTEDGLAIVNKPGTLPEWLPPRRVLQGSKVTSVWADPGPPIRVAAISDGILRVSDNGGRTWQDIQTPALPAALCSGSEDGAMTTFYAILTNGAITRTTDGGNTWKPLPELPLEVAQASLVSWRARGGMLLMAGTSGGTGTLLYGNPEEGSWQTLLAGNLSSAADAGPEGGIFATGIGGVQHSSDEGASWKLLPGGPREGSVMAAIPGAAGKPPTLVVGTARGLSMSQDGGESWQEAALPQAGQVVALARDPERRDRVYAALSTGYLYESGNRGQSWEPINTQPLPGILTLYVIRI
jgi:photosystem II stability/assembly factor-like uncharacterized protein